MTLAARAALAAALLGGALGCGPGDRPYLAPPAGVEIRPDAVVPAPMTAEEPSPGSAPGHDPKTPFPEDECMSALDWLARHQSPDGSWDADGFMKQCKGEPCTGAATRDSDVGATGLALLAFLACGETHHGPRYGPAVRAGLKYLKGIQDADGCFGPRTDRRFVEDHALATLAMCEACGMTQSTFFKASAQNAVNFVLQCRNPGSAWGWGSRPGTDDLDVTVWMAMVLYGAQVVSGFEVAPSVFREIRLWLDTITDPVTGRVGPEGNFETATAMGVTVRWMCSDGAGQEDPLIDRATQLCVSCIPAAEDHPGAGDLRFWYFGTMDCFIKYVVRAHMPPSAATERSDRWSRGLSAAVRFHSRSGEAGCSRGSWGPCDPWTVEHGRVASTAFAALLDSYYH